MRRLLRTRWALALAVLVLGGAITAILMTRGTATASSDVVARVKRGDFKVVVTTAGELRALREIKITGPTTLQQAQVFNVKIASLVPEGTVVKEGDMVAELDKTPAATKMAEVSARADKGHGGARAGPARLGAQPVQGARGNEDDGPGARREADRQGSGQVRSAQRPSAKPRSIWRRRNARSPRPEWITRPRRSRRRQRCAKSARTCSGRRTCSRSSKTFCRASPCGRPAAGMVIYIEGVERQEAHGWLADRCLGPVRRDAARSLRHGIGHLRERDRRAQSRKRPARCHYAGRRSVQAARR